MKEPQDYGRRVFLAVTGLTPQIVTETLYALAVKQDPPFVPTEVRIITTEEGAKPAERLLLHPKEGWFHRLRKDYDLDPIAFGPQNIHVVKDADGQPLGDIRSPQDNECAADTIIDIVRGLTNDDDSALHVSIAGGRKTMGYLLGHALTLYGREQDRLSHVLVNAPYETHPDFFYPTPKPKTIRTRGPEGRAYDARDAKVTLADVLFVRLRDGLSPEMLDVTVSYSAVVADATRVPPPLALKLDPDRCRVTAGGVSFEMPAALFATYWMLAERARCGKPGVYRFEEGVPMERYRYYRRIVGDSGKADRAKDAVLPIIRPVNFNPDKHKVNRELVKWLGRNRAAAYLIKKQGRAPVEDRVHHFGLALPPEAIQIADGEINGPEDASRSRAKPPRTAEGKAKRRTSAQMPKALDKPRAPA